MADMIPQGVQTEEFHGGYERGDANIRSVVVSMAAIMSMTFIAMIAALGGFLALRAREEAKDVPPSQVYARVIPPEPRLLPSPITERDDMLPWERAALELSQQRVELERYGYVNQTQGKVKIPVSQAMRDVIQQSLPTRTVPAGRNDLAQGVDTGAQPVTDADLDGSMIPDTTGGRTLDDEAFVGRAGQGRAPASLGTGNLAGSASGETLNTGRPETAMSPKPAGKGVGTPNNSVVERKVAPLGAR